MKKIISWKMFTVTVMAVLGLCLASPAVYAAKGKPNIVVIWGDDVGYWNVSAYNQGMMGYQTPNIDSVAKEGALFTDWYAQQSCTAGRAAFILGQHPFRTGLLTIGMPGSDQGIGDEMVTLATLLKPHGYTSGQFGKNHLGDRDKHLPTVHGFDEFFGNLYHLNAEEEPEGYYYPKDAEFRKQFGPRGVLYSWADGKGGQKIEDTGHMTKKRMETADDEFADAANFLRQNTKLIIVNATDTPGADTGNGHAYFRQSPSTSSDILATLIFDLKPEERGLEQTGGRPIWTFSADYIDKLRAALVKARSN